MYMAQGFETCTDGEYEANYEKVAIYSKIDAQTYDDEWTHAARLRPDGWWESKVGKSEDIIHRTATVFIGNEYGTKIIYMKRLIALRLKRQLHYLKVPEQGISFVGIRP
jgi:hypothetical protein